MSRIFGFSPVWKIVSIGILILTLLIPLMMIRSLIQERNQRYREAVSEISSKWGQDQSLSGPMIAVPYTKLKGHSNDGPIYENQMAYFLPDDLRIEGNLTAETRRRSIYEAVLYSVELNVHGSFVLPAREDFGDVAKIDWDRAFLVVGITDTRGVKEDLSLEWMGKRHSFFPGTNGSQLFSTGLHSPLALDGRKQTASFAFRVRLLGSSSLRFLPAGKSTKVTMDSPWRNPGFIGSLLPEKREISDTGFHSEWNVSYYGRSYGQSLLNPDDSDKGALTNSEFGFELVQTVDHYQKTERAAKYGILFLLLTFTAVFLFEVFAAIRIHPLQYLMVGSAMVLFYLLFLSLSEQAGFLIAYLASSAATIGSISSYSAVILQGRKRALILAGFLAGLYTYLYVVMTSEDSALLLGSIALFALLGVTMFLTRGIDWYTVGKPQQESMQAQTQS